MPQEIQDLYLQSKHIAVPAVLVALTLFATVLAVRVVNRVIARTAHRQNIAERRSDVVSKFTRALIYLISAAVISNVLGFGVEGIFLATSSFFALVGVAFFANWSILSNATASVILYFAFPFRIGDRIMVENEPRFTGVLKDVTLFFLRIETDLGSTITIPANVAIQKVITIQSDAERRQIERELAERAGQA